MMIITFDIGGTSIKYGLIDNTKSDLIFEYQREVESNAKQIKGPGIVQKLIEIIESEKDKIEGIAISTAGMVDADEGSIIYANENIPEYTGIKIKSILESKFCVPCWVENDVNAAALGEMTFGSGKGFKDALVLTIGTGIGGAVVIDNKIFRGHSHSAGEIGYMWQGDSHYESICSTSALVRNVENTSNEKNLNGRIIFERANNGDKICQKAIEDMCDNIIKGISNCICILNPEAVILGGGIMSQQDCLYPIMKKSMEVYLNEYMLENTKLLFAKFGNSAGMTGAYAYWIYKEKQNV